MVEILMCNWSLPWAACCGCLCWIAAKMKARLNHGARPSRFDRHRRLIAYLRKRSAFGVRRSVRPRRLSARPPRRLPIQAISPCFGDESSNSLPPATSNSLPSIAGVPLPSGVGRPSRFESRVCPRRGLHSFQALDLAERVARARPASLSQGGATKPLRKKAPKRPPAPVR